MSKEIIYNFAMQVSFSWSNKKFFLSYTISLEKLSGIYFIKKNLFKVTKKSKSSKVLNRELK